VRLLHVGAEQALLRQQLVVAPDGETAPMPAGAARARDQFAAHHAEGGERLHHLGREDGAVAAVRVDRGKTVAVRRAAHAAADDVGDDVVGLLAALARHLRPVVEAAGAEGGKGDLAAGRGAVRHQRRERLQDGVGQALLRQVAHRDSGGPLRVQQRALGHLHGHRPVAAFVLRDLRRQQALQRVVHHGERRGVGVVQRVVALRTGAGEVYRQPVALDDQRRADHQRLGAGHLVLGQHLALVAAVGQRGDAPAHVGFGIVEAGGGELLRLRDPIAAVELGDAPLAGAAAGDLRAQIAQRGARVAHVGGQDVEDRRDGLAGVHQLHRRQDQALGEDLRVVRCLGAGDLAADVDVVRDGRGDRDEIAPDEDRAEQHDVGRVRAALVGIVGDVDVAGLPAGQRVRRDHVPEGGRHDAELGGDGARLRQHLALRSEEAAGIVVHVPDDRGIGGAPQRHRHLLGDADQRLLEDVAVDRVDRAVRERVHGEDFRTYRAEPEVPPLPLRERAGVRGVGWSVATSTIAPTYPPHPNPSPARGRGAS